MAQIAGIHRLETIHVNQPSNIRITPALVHQTLKEHPDITHAALVHHETTTGILNPVRDIQAILRDHSVSLIVDAMSSFGGIPMDFQPDFLISSANKCLESVPGCAFVIATRSALARTHQTPTHSLTTTLHPLWKSLETTGQFLYTPPTNVIAALDIALSDTLAEGVSSRNARYRLYNDIIRARMRRMGIVPYLEHHHGPIITTFRYPTPDFDFQSFYNQLAARGVTLYPGVTDGVFRIGNIGHLSLDDIQTALTAIEHVVRGLTLSIEEGVFAHPM
jgi:2-aminoethylphosphonate-pyruvate transaminase